VARLNDRPSYSKDWQTRWERYILDEPHRNRYCDTAMGEELRWLSVSADTSVHS